MKNITRYGLFFCITSMLNAHDFKIRSLFDILPTRPDIQYFHCHDEELIDYKPFPISVFPDFQPHKGLLAPTFVVKIPQGQVCSQFGWIKIGDCIIQEFMSQNYSMRITKQRLEGSSFKSLTKVSGRVAVITRSDAGCYGHWLRDILGRLALLEMHGIEYDWLYVEHHKPYMKATLQLFGVDPNKIIEPTGSTNYIQADELIVPSLSFRRIPQEGVTFQEFLPLTSYFPQWIIDYYRNKFLPLILEQSKNYNFSKKIFISRNDAGFRRVINEDDVFELFKKQGFERYALSKLSVVEQMILLHNADIVVTPHGSGMINLLYSKPGTTFIEIFQARSDATYFYLPQKLKLNYFYIQTMSFTAFPAHDDTVVPLSIIQEFIDQHTALFS